MITLERIRLVNWHYFQESIIPVGNFCLLSGDNGSGKSTIVDAIQLVMASDLRKVRFNASASDRRGGRDLAGYVRCKLGSDSTDYLRDDAVGHVMLEFSEGDTIFSAGICAEAWRDGRVVTRFWISDGLAIDRVPIRSDDGPPYLSRQFQEALSAVPVTFYESGSAFRRDFTGKLGVWRRMSENNPYLDAFVRSIHFTPLVSVDQFVCDYILEEQLIDLSVMKQNLESYRQAEDLARATRNRITSLDELLHGGDLCRSQERVLVQQDWLRARLQVDRKKDELDDAVADERRLAERAECIINERAVLEENKLSLERERRETEAALSRNDAYLLHSTLTDRLAELEQRIGETGRRVERRDLLLSQCTALYTGIFPDSALDPATIGDARERIARTQEETGRERAHGDLEKRTMEARLRDVREELSELDRGIRRLPDPAVRLRDALREAGVDAWILCDLAEVTDPAWSDAIEGWLNTLRFACIVAPEDFARALEVYDRLPRSVGGIPLPDISRMASDKTRSEVRKGSLAELVTTENPWARTYLDCVLGDVMTADLASLRRYSKAVTKECMSWSRYTAIRIREEVYRDAWLGKAARERRKALLQEERETLLSGIESLGKEQTRLAGIADACRSLLDSLTEVQVLGETVAEHERLVDESKRIEKQRAAVDTSAFEDMKKRIQALQEEVLASGKKISVLDTESGSVNAQLVRRKTDIVRGQEAYTGALDAFKRFRSDHEDAAADCERYVAERLKAQSPEEILKNLESARKGAESRLQTLLREFRDKVTLYNRSHNELFSGELDELPAMQELVTRLKDSELPDYLEKIRQAKQDAEAEFKDHFIARLNELIEEAKESFSEINSTLRSMEFGRDQYRFTLTEKSERRGQIEIIKKTAEIAEYEHSLFDALVDPSDRDAANTLFNKILNSDLQSAELRSLCDYRTYFTYDIRVKDTQSVDPATGSPVEYSLSRVLKEKSGGEAQTPYYVAIAASFFRFYRDRSTPTIRFVLFDEAFDRLDDERIAKVLDFYRELGLQVLISVPTEKLESIAPHMDTVNLVIRHGHRAAVIDFYDRGESDE